MTQTLEIVHIIFSIHHRGIIDNNTEYFSPIAIYHFYGRELGVKYHTLYTEDLKRIMTRWWCSTDNSPRQ